MEKARWHYVDGARSKGPYSLAELHHLQAQGRVTAQTLVWCEGMPGWQPLDTVGVGAPPTTAGFDTAPHDPYRAPGASAGPHPAASAADRLPGEMAPYAAFVGKRFSTYRKRWRLDFGGANAASTWHWPGFLFGVVWLMYRRMYGIAAVWYGVMIALTVLEKVAGLPEVVTLFVSVGLSITAGACGNAWYLSHCQRNIAEVRRLRGYDEPRRLRVLAERGGTSVGSALAALGIALAMSVLGLLMAA
ncbi:hypothetical protein C1924_19970 [Stenotrophomonas sp. ESTM1D_MKCIP4_1]|uniref:GYF domain-containing protein n=1 Tax=Stenotrophomonas sp. ESTM1D_MKCIP4_1 TaxID=2072414 RepID=UPI000D53E39B|nr:GYF domain-containing protein [Stenotrophomonas sp. ESTM1D_MKCIP4_1]AWH55310.1 hypothetical protein C1924_19970 [Stenotrophomonas sp. ESTM1D_MKCIP4_1]